MGRSAEQFVAGQLVPGTKYRTRSLMGTGGMGSVYEVEHTELGKLFVLKVLRAGLVERTDLAARMKNEWRALGRLQHPNIVAVTDAGSTEDGVPFFVMERLDGETLATRVRREGRLSIPLALRISVGLLDALAAAHAIGVVHRDIKPQNVFLPASGGVKLLDFGIAKLQDRDRDAHVVTVRGVAIGTPRYMSPEQAEGKTVDGRADIYAVALVLFEMIAGRGPFSHRRDPNELVLAHMSETPARLDAESDAPPELADMVQRWLAKAPEDRPTDATAAAHELRALLGRYTFDAGSMDPTNEPTAHADYEAPTHAGQPQPPRGGASRGRTLSLGTAPTALDESVTRVEAPRVARGASAGGGSAHGDEALDGASVARGGDTELVTGTVTPPDAPTTRTVLPALDRPGGRADDARARGAAAEGAKVKGSARRERFPRSETPPPVEPPRQLPERPWLRMTGVAAAAALASFAASVLMSQPASVGDPAVGLSPSRTEGAAAARPAPPVSSEEASPVALPPGVPGSPEASTAAEVPRPLASGEAPATLGSGPSASLATASAVPLAPAPSTSARPAAPAVAAKGPPSGSASGPAKSAPVPTAAALGVPEQVKGRQAPSAARPAAKAPAKDAPSGLPQSGL